MDRENVICVAKGLLLALEDAICVANGIRSVQ